MKLICNKRSDKLYSENTYYDVFTTIPHIELGLKQAAVAVYPPRSIQNDDEDDDDDSKQKTVIQKFQDDSPPSRLWIDFLLHKGWIASCRDIIMLLPSFKYCTIATAKSELQNKVVSTKTIISIFPDIAKGVKNSEN